MKPHLAICIAALAVACSPAPETDADKPAGDAPAAKRVPLPDCTAVEAKDEEADGWKHPDCRLVLADQSGLAFEARYAPAEDDSTEVTVQVVAAGDATVQEIKERMGNTFNAPATKDFDGDGKADILLPLETSNSNTTWAVWRQVDGQKFVRVGEPNGAALVKTAGGEYAIQARSTETEYAVTFFTLANDKLEPLATADLVADGEPGKVKTVSCSVVDDGGLAAAGLTPETAKAKFCSDETVTGLIKDMMPTP